MGESQIETSFRKHLQDENFCRLFRDFVKDTHSSENFTFWLEIEQYRKIPPTDTQAILQHSLRIYLTYFKSDSNYEINITAKERTDIEEQLKLPNRNIFDDVQNSIFRLMAMDSYLKFTRTDTFQNLFSTDRRPKLTQHRFNTWNPKKHSALSRTTLSDSAPTLAGRPELKRLDSGLILDTYLVNLRGKIDSEESGTAQKLLPEDTNILCHVQIVSDKTNFKIVQFDPMDSVSKAIERIATKIRLPQETWKGWALRKSSNGTEEVLDPSKTLSFYSIKSSDTLIFSKEEGSQGVPTEERLLEVTFVNLKGEEEQKKLNFSIPVSKVISSICYHYGYDEDPHLCLKVKGNSKITGKKMMVIADEAFSPRNRAMTVSEVGNKVFGLPLSSICVKRENKIILPYIFTSCVKYLERVLDTEFLLKKRILNSETIRTYQVIINSGGEVDFSKSENPHIVGSLLLQWLEELPEPLLTFDLYDEFINLQEPLSKKQLRGLFSRLPNENVTLIKELLSFLVKFLDHSMHNKVPVERLSGIFGNIFLRPKNGQNKQNDKVTQIITAILENPQRFFLVTTQIALSPRKAHQRRRSMSVDMAGIQRASPSKLVASPAEVELKGITVEVQKLFEKHTGEKEASMTDLAQILATIQERADKALDYVKLLELEKSSLKRLLENK